MILAAPLNKWFGRVLGSASLVLGITSVGLCTALGQTSSEDGNEKQERLNEKAILASLPPDGEPSEADIKADGRTSMTFDIGLQPHANPREKGDKRSIVVITEFLGGNILREYSLSGQGQEEDFLNMVGWSQRDDRKKQLNRNELTFVHSILSELLPSTTKSTPYGKLCLVSYEENSKWISRWYNRDDYPLQLKQLLDLFNKHS